MLKISKLPSAGKQGWCPVSPGEARLLPIRPVAPPTRKGPPPARSQVTGPSRAEDGGFEPPRVFTQHALQVVLGGSFGAFDHTWHHRSLGTW